MLLLQEEVTILPTCFVTVPLFICMGISYGQELEAFAIQHTEKAIISSVTGFFNKVINPTIEPTNLRLLQHSPQTRALPVTIPLIGGGHLSLGVSGYDSFAPVAYVELEYSDTHYQSQKPAVNVKEEIDRVFYNGVLPFKKSPGKFEFANVDRLLKEKGQKDLFKALAKLNLTKEVDLAQLRQATPEQRWLLAQFGIQLS